MIELLGDLGTEESLFLSPKTWREIFKPRMKALIDSVKRKKKAEAGKLKRHEQAELTFLRNLGADSIEFSEAKFDDGAVSADKNKEADRCPAGGRIGYDLDSLKECCDCEARVICLQTAEKIEEAFK